MLVSCYNIAEFIKKHTHIMLTYKQKHIIFMVRLK